METKWIDKYLKEAENLVYDGDTENAIALMESLLYDEPGYDKLHNLLGWAFLYYDDNKSRAELHFRTAIRFNEKYSSPYLHLGYMYLRMNRFSDAVEMLEKGLPYAESNLLSFNENLGTAYEGLREFGKAIAAYKKALTLSHGADGEGLITRIKMCRKKRIQLLF